MLETILFYLIALGIVVSALGVVFSRSAIYGVLSLVLTLCLTAGLFILLKAFLVATILVLVYAGAILVLFLFVVMLIDIGKLENGWRGFGVSQILACAAGALLFLEIGSVIQSISTESKIPLHGTTEAIASILFTRYALPFELTSFLLLTAIVSVVVLAKKEAA
jgi:NADH-quinone oxidoreductase subunit J